MEVKMMSKNISGLIKRNADLSAEKELNVKKAIEELKKSKKAFSVSEVCREAGVSRQYLHKHPDLLELVYKVSNTSSRSGKRNKDSMETHISILKATIREKDREIERLKRQHESNESYKEKYELAQAKIKELEMQLEEAYSLNLPTSL